MPRIPNLTNPDDFMRPHEVRQSASIGNVLAAKLKPLHEPDSGSHERAGMLRYKSALTVQAIEHGIHSAAEMGVEYSRGTISYQEALAGVKYLVRRVPELQTASA